VPCGWHKMRLARVLESSDRAKSLFACRAV
jgi:hypothetical protein